MKKEGEKISSLEKVLKEMAELYGTFKEREEKLRRMVGEAQAELSASSKELSEKLTSAAKELASQFLSLDESVLKQLHVSCNISYPGEIAIVIYINTILDGVAEEYELIFLKRAANLLGISEDHIKVAVSSIGPF